MPFNKVCPLCIVEDITTFSAINENTKEASDLPCGFAVNRFSMVTVLFMVQSTYSKHIRLEVEIEGMAQKFVHIIVVW